MALFAFRATCIMILSGCISGSRISPKGVSNGKEAVGTRRTGQTSEEGDATMLLQGVRGVNVHHGDADSHSNEKGVKMNHGDAHIHGRGSESKRSSDAACTSKVPGDCDKRSEGHGKEMPALAQMKASVGSWTFNPSDYVSVVQTLMHRHFHMNAGPPIFVILFASLVIVCFLLVLMKNVGTNQMFGNDFDQSPKQRVREAPSSDAFRERTQPLTSPEPLNLRKPSPIVSSRNMPPSTSPRPSMQPMPRPSTLYDAPRPATIPQAAVEEYSFAGSHQATAGQPADIAGGYQSSNVAAIPPLCPKMSMPACEARFLIPKHAIGMVAEGGALKIVGLSGSALFQATVRTVKGYRLLEMSLCTDLATPCATIRLDHPEAPSGAVIRGEGGAYYGILEMRSDGSCEVTRDDRTLMFIEADTDSLTLSLKAPRGQILATVSCLEHVDIKVSQGNDVVLLISCILAVLIQSAPPNF